MESITIIQAIILGLVEGLTEYLPVSSTGHLIITSALLGLDAPEERKAAVDAFTIVIQGGAILAVLGLYRSRVAQMLRGVIGRDEAGRRLATNLIIAFLPALFLGPLLHEAILTRLFSPVPVIAALALGGLLMIVLGPWQRSFFHGTGDVDPPDAHSFVDIEHLTWRRALLIGVLQCIAMWPGISRSLMAIVGGMVVGMRPRQAAEFSFLLGLPTLGGACVYKVVSDLMHEGGSGMFTVIGPLPMIAGLLVSTLSAAVAVRWLVHFLHKHGVAAFGWYRLVLCVVLTVLVLRGGLAISP